MSGSGSGSDPRRELREALRALENALVQVRQAQRMGLAFDASAVRDALDLAEAEVKAARDRLRKAEAQAGADGTAPDGA